MMHISLIKLHHIFIVGLVLKVDDVRTLGLLLMVIIFFLVKIKIRNLYYDLLYTEIIFFSLKLKFLSGGFTVSQGPISL